MDWQVDEEVRASPNLAFDFDIPVMFFDDLMDDRQTQASTFPLSTLVLGGVERVEYVLEVYSADACPGVSYLDLYPAVAAGFTEAAGFDGQSSPAISYRIQGIKEQV